ncbi:Putative RNA-binding protein Luc7-like 1, partial [Sarcoptes scabiei]
AEAIGKKLAAAETAGSEGNVEESLKLMEEIEKIKKEKNAAELEYKNSIPTSSYQQQKLRVCEVCSAYLGIQDNDRRLADHFGGKLHLGFIAIREKLEELRKLVAENKKKGVYEQLELEKEKHKSRYDRDRRSRYDDDRERQRRSRSRIGHFVEIIVGKKIGIVTENQIDHQIVTIGTATEVDFFAKPEAIRKLKIN